jgi:Icc protein
MKSTCVKEVRLLHWVLTWVTAWVLCACLLSCRDLFQYSPNEIRLEDSEKSLNARALERLAAQPQRDTFKFILIGDTQRFYEEVEDFVRAANGVPGAAFVLLAGDISDFGLSKEFRWIHERLKNLRMPYVAVIGNHDMLANGALVYKEMYGPENFSFTYGATRFVCLNTNSNERGNDGTIPDLPWLTKELTELTEYRNAFVVSHMAPFHNGFDRNLEQGYVSLMASNPKVRLSLHGHQHTWSRSSPYGDGKEYVTVGSMDKRNYALISVEGDQYRIEEVYY